jgi:hypothetical protein
MNPDAVLDEDQKKIRFRKLLLKQQRLWDNGRHDKVHLQDSGNYNDAEAKMDYDDCNVVHDDYQKTESKPDCMEEQKQNVFQLSVPSCSRYHIQNLDQKQHHSQSQNDIQNQSQTKKNNPNDNQTQTQNPNLKQSLFLDQLQSQNDSLRQTETEQN